MRKFSLILALCLFGPYAIATPPVYGPLQAQNNLDDVDSASTSLGNLGGAPLASPTFTGTVTIPSGSVLNTPASINLTNATGIPYSGLPALAANQLLGSLTATTPSGQSVPSCSASTNALLWTSGTGFGCNTSINAGTLGGATFASPGAIGSGTASSGAFTTLSASSMVSGTGFLNYLASPPSIGGTTPASGNFTTLDSSGNDALLYDNTSAQAISSVTTTTITGWTKIFDRLNTNFNSSTGTFTAPTNGYYMVTAQVTYGNFAVTTNNLFQSYIVGNGTVDCNGLVTARKSSTIQMSTPVSCLVFLSSGQTIVLQTRQNTGSTVSLGTTPNTNWISMNKNP